MSLWRRFLADERGQDLVEYTLLIAFLSLVAAAIYVEQGGSLSRIWGLNSSQLDAAMTAAS